MRVLFSGSRLYNEHTVIEGVILGLDKSDIVIHGDCPRGADKHVNRAALKFGLEVEAYPAKWTIYGQAAGNIRNQLMLDYGRPDRAYLFWDGRSPGTKDMLERVLNHNIPYKLIAKKGCEQIVQDRCYEMLGVQTRLF